MKLYRTVSYAEWKDYQRIKRFRTAKNTLEGKQFFKSEAGAIVYKMKADARNFQPPYRQILVIDLDEECLNRLTYEEQILDDYDAITIPEDDLKKFNDCVRFVDRYDI